MMYFVKKKFIVQSIFFRLCGQLAAESYRRQTTKINDGKASLGYQPPPLTSTYAAVNKDQLVATRCTRFAKYSL